MQQIPEWSTEVPAFPVPAFGAPQSVTPGAAAGRIGARPRHARISHARISQAHAAQATTQTRKPRSIKPVASLAAVTVGAFLAFSSTATTMAMWNHQAGMTAPSLNSGAFALADDSSCTPWVYNLPGKQADKQPVTDLIPGDVVTSTCTADIITAGDHLHATGTISGLPGATQAMWQSQGHGVWVQGTNTLGPNPYVQVATTVTTPDNPSGTTATGTTFPISADMSGQSHYPIAITVQVTFPYVGAVSTPKAITGADNATQSTVKPLDSTTKYVAGQSRDLTDAVTADTSVLGTVTVNLTQDNPNG
jgi:alternate signal-mediated exported protein